MSHGACHSLDPSVPTLRFRADVFGKSLLGRCCVDGGFETSCVKQVVMTSHMGGLFLKVERQRRLERIKQKQSQLQELILQVMRCLSLEAR